MGVKCIMIHGTLNRDGKVYKLGDEVPGLSEALIKAYEDIGMISVRRTDEEVPEPVEEEEPDTSGVVMEVPEEEPEPAKPRGRPSKRNKKNY